MEDDVRLDEGQKAIMRGMIEGGMDEREAKLRVLCIATPPDHFRRVITPHQNYPRVVYHADGRSRMAQTEVDHQAATKAGWKDQPTQAYLDKAQGTPPEPKEFEVPAGAAIAVDKQRKADAARQ